MNKSLSSIDILRTLNHNTNIINYSDLIKQENIDDLLVDGNCVILYPQTENYGHWVCLFKRTDNLIEFFDPYGCEIDSQLKYVPKRFKKKYPHLIRLLVESPYTISYNEHQFQRYDENITTCGRWVIARLLLRNLPLNKFKKLFIDNAYEKGITPDYLVTIFTEIYQNIF